MEHKMSSLYGITLTWWAAFTYLYLQYKKSKEMIAEYAAFFEQKYGTPLFEVPVEEVLQPGTAYYFLLGGALVFSVMSLIELIAFLKTGTGNVVEQAIGRFIKNKILVHNIEFSEKAGKWTSWLVILLFAMFAGYVLYIHLTTGWLSHG